MGCPCRKNKKKSIPGERKSKRQLREELVEKRKLNRKLRKGAKNEI